MKDFRLLIVCFIWTLILAVVISISMRGCMKSEINSRANERLDSMKKVLIYHQGRTALLEDRVAHIDSIDRANDSLSEALQVANAKLPAERQRDDLNAALPVKVDDNFECYDSNQVKELNRIRLNRLALKEDSVRCADQVASRDQLISELKAESRTCIAALALSDTLYMNCNKALIAAQEDSEKCREKKRRWQIIAGVEAVIIVIQTYIHKIN